MPGDNGQACEPIGGAPGQGSADQVAAYHQKLILPAPCNIEGAPKLLQAPRGIENRHQDKDSRKIDRRVTVESQDCIGYFDHRAIDQEVTGHCRHHCPNNKFNQEIEPGLTHGCDRCTAQPQGHGEPYKGKDDFGKKHYLNCPRLQVVGKIEIFSSKQG